MRVRHLLAATVLIAMPIVGLGAASAQDSAKGAWARGDGIVRVNVASCGNALCMTNTWVKPGNNEKVGEYIVLNVKPAGDGIFKGNGRDPQRDVTFSAEVTVNSDRMTTSGCVAAVLCRSVQRTRVK